MQEASAGAQPMEEMNDDLENKNIQRVELNSEEQIEMLKAKMKDLEDKLEDLKESGFGAENISIFLTLAL